MSALLQKSQESQETQVENIDEDDDDTADSYHTQNVEETTENSFEVPSTSKITKTRKNTACLPPSKKAKIDSVTAAVTTLQDIARKAEHLQDTADEFEAFGKTVAAHLRRLPLHYALESQEDIMKYLVQKRLGRQPSFFIDTYTSQQNQSFVSPPYPSHTDSSSDSVSVSFLEQTKTMPRPERENVTTEHETRDLLHQAWNNT